MSHTGRVFGVSIQGRGPYWHVASNSCCLCSCGLTLDSRITLNPSQRESSVSLLTCHQELQPAGRCALCVSLTKPTQYLHLPLLIESEITLNLSFNYKQNAVESAGSEHCCFLYPLPLKLSQPSSASSAL